MFVRKTWNGCTGSHIWAVPVDWTQQITWLAVFRRQEKQKYEDKGSSGSMLDRRGSAKQKWKKQKKKNVFWESTFCFENKHMRTCCIFSDAFLGWPGTKNVMWGLFGQLFFTDFRVCRNTKLLLVFLRLHKLDGFAQKCCNTPKES